MNMKICLTLRLLTYIFARCPRWPDGYQFWYLISPCYLFVALTTTNSNTEGLTQYDLYYKTEFKTPILILPKKSFFFVYFWKLSFLAGN